MSNAGRVLQPVLALVGLSRGLTKTTAVGENRNMTLDKLRGSRRDEILRLAATYGARNVRVFGSLARGNTLLPVISTCSSTWIRTGA